MKPELNSEKLQQTIKLQQKASDPNNCVFVSASAGSGKTKILTDRVLRLLLRGVAPNKILCLTYTKVAAFEMQNRIYKELSDWSILAEADLQKRIFNLTGINYSSTEILPSRTLFNVILDDFEGIKINTIHSFCQNLMTKFPVEAQIKPNFKIIDSQTENKLLLESKNKLLQSALNDENLAKKIAIISANLNEDSFAKIILELINKRTDLEIAKENFFGLENLNQKIIELLKVENLDENKIKDLIFDPQTDPNFDKENLEKAAKLASQNFKSKQDPERAQIILNYLQNPNEDNFDQYLKTFLTTENEPRKDVFTKSFFKQYSDFESVIKLEQNRILNLLETLNSFHIAHLTTNLLDVADKMLAIYFELKNQNNYLDYNDLITKTSKLLHNKENSEWIKYKLDGAIEHILVDESQDTNNHQWKIIKAISEDFFLSDESQERTIFVVGDDKQSIFNFQGAQPRIFGNVLNYYQNQLQMVDKNIENISLNNSFRSLKNILQAVDDSFSDPKYKKAISPINLVNHSSIRTNFHGKVELWPIVNIKKERKQNNEDFSWKLNFDPKETHNSQEILAQIIAKKIKSWIENKRILQSQNRPVMANDIMILIKNRTNNLGNLISKNLQKEGIEVNGNDKIELVKNIIVQDLLALAKFLLLNEDDLNLAALLKSPLISLSENDLFELCDEKNQKQISLYSTLRNSRFSHIKSAFIFLEEIKKYYEENPYQIHKLFLHILEIKNKKAQIITNFGKESKEILNQFLTLCLNFEENEIASLENFITSLENSELKIKIEGGNNDFDEVKITTIHSAKGLEAEIVILADCAHDNKNKYGANNERIVWLNKDDLKIPFWPAGKSNQLIKEIKESERKIQNDEYLRLLYVAMTRAKDELYIAGFGKYLAEDCWYNIVKNHALSQAKTQESGFEKLVDLPIEEFLENDEILVIEDENEVESEPNLVLAKEVIKFEIPQFLNQKSKIEKTQNIIYPSKQEKEWEFTASPQNRNNIGAIIHKILEIFPKNSQKSQNSRDLIENYLENHHNYLKNEEKIEILRQISNIFDNPKFDFIFSSDSQSEVPIIGKINDQLISGKIDRLIINENEILIIDYKSDKISESEIVIKTQKYLEQLNFYAQIIAQIYPTKKIRCAIIWTYLGEISFL